MASYERLSVLDRTFLDVETPHYPQHVGVTLLFEAAPVTLPDGGVDADRIRAYIGSRLHRMPRYRQKLSWIPIENHPVWVDDASFNLEYHVRHTSLPQPGDERQLKRLCARLMSQRLDRDKPLWEVWIVEGIARGRFALITKTHHCMIDGIAGLDLLAILLSTDPDEDLDAPVEWLPERSPSRLMLGFDEILRRATMPLRGAGAVARALQDPGELAAAAAERIGALRQTLVAALTPASDTPLNRPLGPHRRFDWTSFALEHVKEVKNRLGGTVNDVVLTTVTGALARFLEQRGVTRAAQRDLDLRAMVPVSVRSPSQRGATGNKIALWAVPLPVGETDPKRRLAAIRAVTARLKATNQALGAEVLAAVSEWTVPTLLSIATRMAYRSRAANLVVTNVPGPQVPLYLIGARMVDAYPMLNLLINQSLGVALVSYAGRLGWGFMADWELIPDLHAFVRAVEDSFHELCDSAELKRPARAR
ncbi:MAG: wax ester/triacylglycerol synthase family O-acyltransferase [Deltaproteobacteria bacterium]|nr:MAG: wax ester/triacylglycerol synthase family O-acyltransferase [Deltaproteobacteria bacterium]